MGYKNQTRQREYQRAWMKQRRDEWISANGPCQRCGTDQRLEVDHVDAKTKALPLSKVWGLCADRRAIELAKCQVLCEPCHQEKTLECSDQVQGERHGNARLTADNVREIRQRYSAGGVTMAEVGAPFGMDKKNVWEIVHRHTWKSVE